MNSNLLGGQALRDADGGDNGVRMMDLNLDGYQDVLIGNGVVQQTRIWNGQSQTWIEQELPFSIVTAEGKSSNVRFAAHLDERADTVAILPDGGAYGYTREGWSPLPDIAEATAKLNLTSDTPDSGFRFRDINSDGTPELLVANGEASDVYGWENGWSSLGYSLPEGLHFVDAHGRDAGLRLLDLDEDGDLDIVYSNESTSQVHRFESNESGWGESILPEGKRLPAITVEGENNGVFFHSRAMWLVNETTSQLPDWAEPHTFNEILGSSTPNASTPEGALATFHLRPGYEIQQVAAEPLVMDPVAMEWGADGALWVMEMRDYPRGLDEVENQPGSRVRLLRDTDGDGVYDQSTIFLDGLGFATGLHPWRDGVLVTAAPQIIFAVDTDGDDKADTQEVLYEGFGEGNQQHRVNGLRWGLDNWLHGANGDSSGEIHSLKSDDKMTLRGRDFRIQPDGGRIEALAGQTQFGRSRDNWGNWFGCTNSNQGFHYTLDDRYTRRNPHIPVPDARSTSSRIGAIIP